MAEAGKRRDEDEPEGKRRAAGGKANRKDQDEGGESLGRRRADLISAIAHPLRRRMLRALHDRGEPASPVQLAKELGVPLGGIAYHFRVLEQFCAVVLAGERQVRGAIQHFFASTIENDPPIEALLEETREVDEEDA